jgi:ABC-type nitrate/sulfonate/bicarbonate transport system substrate-binding protein
MTRRSAALRWGAAWLLILLLALPLLWRAAGAAPLTHLTLFSQQQVQTIAFEFAHSLGYFKQEGLDVAFEYFASGTTAFQVFRTGRGDIVFSGDVPAINYWAQTDHDYRVIAPVEREQKGYELVVKSSIATPQDLRGKVLATRIGSTGSHFFWKYLRKYGMTEADVTIKNMDGPTMISALDRGDIDGFFLWAPYPQRAVEVSGSKVRVLADAGAVVAGYYTVIGVRAEWLSTHAPAVEGFLRAAVKGQQYALTHKSSVVKYVNQKYGLDPASSSAQFDNQQMLLRFDAAFYRDFADFAQWMQSAKMMKEPLAWSSFIYPDGLRKVDSALVAQPPK